MTTGLRLRIDLETALELADDQPELGVGIQRWATQAIRSPFYQRMGDEMEDHSSDVLKERMKELHVRNFTTEQGLPHADVQHIIDHMPPDEGGGG